MKKTVLICGAGGFIGGHLAASLIKEKKFNIICADIKPFKHWFQFFDKAINFSLDLKELKNCLKVTDNVDYIYNMACNMGGMGFIENNKAECMLSVLINTNLLRASLQNKISKYFFSSSACVYNITKQSKNFIKGLKEEDAYPAQPEDGYGWEKLFSERLFLSYHRNYKLPVAIARYHNIYGPLGTWDGGREKAPAAICRKIAKLDTEGGVIEVWGDGLQTRSFLYIEDCINATRKLMESNFAGPVNIGSEEMVTINQLVEYVSKIAIKKVERKHKLDAPLGVRGRNSDNRLIEKELKWKPEWTLSEGLKETYAWINDQVRVSV